MGIRLQDHVSNAAQSGSAEVRPRRGRLGRRALVASAATAGLGLALPTSGALAQTADMTVVADKLAIMELASAFETAFDRGDLEAMVAMWTDDGVFVHPFGTFEGKDAFRGWAEGQFAQSAASGGTRHLVTNFEIAVAGEAATMTCYLTLFAGRVSPTPLIILGVFTDQLVKVDGAWAFARRELVVDTQFGPPPDDAPPATSPEATPVA